MDNVGIGETASEAQANLSERFSEYRSSKQSLPRPGTRVPISFADSSIVDSYPDISQKFFQRVLGFDAADPVFISDESSLFDFDGVNGGIDLVERTKAVFGVDVSDIEDRNLAKIFTRIKESEQRLGG